MDLESEILSVRSKVDAVRVADWVGADRRRFNQLMKQFLEGEYRVAQQSAWILGVCYDRHPWLITPWLGAIVKRIQEPGVHDGVIRNAIRILQCVEIPKELLGTVVALCFEYLNSYDTPIAVKAFSMTVLANAVDREPALQNELNASLTLLLQSPSAAVRARARMMLERLAKRHKKKSPSLRRSKA